MTVQTIACGDNRYTNSTAPTVNQAQSGQLHSLNTLASYMEFTLPSAPGGESLQSAELQIRTTAGSTAGTLTVHTFSLTALFDPATITWNTRPSPISTLGTISEAAVDTPYSIALDKAVLAPLAGTTIGIGVATTGLDNLQFWSGTYSVTTYRPVLVLTYATSTVVTVMNFNTPFADSQVLTSDTPTIVNTQVATSTISGAAAIIPWTDAKFAFRSGIPVVGAVFPDTTLGAHNTRYPNTWGSPPNVSFDISVTGTEIEFQYKQAAASPSASVWYRIDGVPLTDVPTVLGMTNGGRFVQKLTWATSATRIISVDTSYAPLGGVFTNTANTVINTAPAIGPMLLVQGDSITGGSGQNTGTINGTWLKRFAFAVKLRRAWNQGIGGTGYLATNGGASVTMRARIADISSYTPNVCIIFAGYNDLSSTQSALQTEADLFYTAVKTAVAAGGEIYVIGCYSPLFFPAGSVQNVDNWLRPRAAAAGLPYASPVTGNCYDKFGVQIGFVSPIITGSAEQALWTGADNVHPTDAGHKRIAEWMYNALKILSTPTGSSLAAPTVAATQTVNSQQTVNIVASIVGTATAWNISQTAGTPTVTITNLGNGTFTFKAPAKYGNTNTTLTFSITATTASGTTAAATTNVVLKPHRAWQRGIGGSVPQIPLVYGFNTETPPVVEVTPWLPFEMPSRASMEAITAYRVGTHPMMNYTVGVNNTGTSEATDYWATHWLPNGNVAPSAGKPIFSAPGTNIIAECRDRLPFRPPRTGADGVWQMKDHKDMLRWLKDAGFDFAAPHVAFNDPTDFEYKQLIWYLDAAADLGGIKIMPWVDGSVSLLDNVPNAISLFAAMMNDSTRGPAFLQISGKKAFVCYYPEATGAGSIGVGKWRQFKDGLTASASAPYFWSSWQGSPWHVKATTLYSGASETYDQIFDAHSNFGQRDPNSTNSTSIEAQGAAPYCNSVLGKPWMAPCSVQAVVPRGNPTGTSDHGWFWEALGFGQMIASAMSAINNNSNYMEWNTMNDFPEGSHITASRDNKRNWLDLISYFNVWFKTRSAPTVTRNGIYIANRPQKALGTTIYTSATDKFLTRESGTAITDVVDVLVFLKQSADVTVTVGGVDTVSNGLPIGMNRLTVTARVGSVSVVAKAAGTGTIISQCTSRFPILGTTNVQDLAYRVTSSFESVARPELFIGG